MGNPFDDVVTPGLEEATMASLEAERDQLADTRKPHANDQSRKPS